MCRKLSVCLFVGLSFAAFSAAQAGVIGVTNGDFETYDGEQQLVGDGWYEDGGTWYETFCAKPFGDNSTEVLIIAGADRYVYQQIGTLDADMTVTVSGMAMNGSNYWEDFGTLEVSLWAGNVAPAHGSTLSSLGATMVASVSFSAADIGLDTEVNPSSMNWSFDLATSGGVAGTSLWLQLTPTSGAVHLDNIAASAIPEPSSIILLSAGLIGLLCYAWRKRK